MFGPVASLQAASTCLAVVFFFVPTAHVLLQLYYLCGKKKVCWFAPLRFLCLPHDSVVPPFDLPRTYFLTLLDKKNARYRRAITLKVSLHTVQYTYCIRFPGLLGKKSVAPGIHSLFNTTKCWRYLSKWARKPFSSEVRCLVYYTVKHAICEVDTFKHKTAKQFIIATWVNRRKKYFWNDIQFEDFSKLPHTLQTIFLFPPLPPLLDYFTSCR